MTNTSVQVQQPIETAALEMFGPAREHFRKLATDQEFIKEAGFAYQLMRANDYLANTSRESQLQALMNLVDTGLSLNPIMKYAYLVPRKGKCVLEPSYIGLVKLLTDSGSVKSIERQIIWQGDEVDIDMSTERKVLKHKPYMLAGNEKGAMLAVYSIATLPDGSKHFELMSKADIDEIMKRSESYKAWKGGKVNSCTWSTDYEEMASKTVLRRHQKYLPKSAKYEQIAKAVALDEQDFEGSVSNSPSAQPPAAPLSDIEQHVQGLKDRILKAWKSYNGSDKKELKQQCAMKSQSGELDVEFWEGMVKKVCGDE